MKLAELLEYAIRSPYRKNFGDWSTFKQKVPEDNHERKFKYMSREYLEQIAKDFAEKHGMTVDELDELSDDDWNNLSLKRNVPIDGKKSESPKPGERTETRLQGRKA